MTPALPRSLPRASALGAISLAALLGVGCEKTVPLNLNLIEPFDQQDQSLNGIKSLRVEYVPEDPTTHQPAAPEQGDSVNITTDDTGAATNLQFALDEPVYLTVRAYEGDVTTDSSIISQPPDAIGRTVPVRAGGGANTLDVTVPVGLLDSFGQTTTLTEEGASDETRIDGGAAVPGRHGHTATYLPTIGQVLIFGGAVWIDDPMASADLPQCRDFETGRKCFTILGSVELYDPATGVFTRLDDSQLGAVTPRAYHTATLLPDGRVLIAGGFAFLSGALDTLSSGLIFDPEELDADPFDITTFSTQRGSHTAVLIEDQGDSGQVALIGGCTGTGCTPFGSVAQGPDPEDDPVNKMRSVIEIFDVADESSTNVPLDEAFEQQLARTLHASSRLGDFIVVSGGLDGQGTKCSVEILGIREGTLVQPEPYPSDDIRALTDCPAGHTQVTLDIDNGAVAIIGGLLEAPGGVVSDMSAPTSKVQFWKTTGLTGDNVEMLSGRAFHSSVLLDGNTILNVGGRIPLGGATAEKIVEQAGGGFAAAQVSLPLPEARQRLGVAAMPNNQVLITGGYSSDGHTTDRAEIYFGP